MNKNLILIRGISGSGKTTFAELICDTVFSADDYFMTKDGEYEFDATYLPSAHEACRWRTEDAMKKLVPKICVANTFTQEWEMKEYFVLAKKYGYRTFTIVVENRVGSQNIHGVPDNVLQKQRERFSIKL